MRPTPYPHAAGDFAAHDWRAQPLSKHHRRSTASSWSLAEASEREERAFVRREP
jgi:hypothetical protein